MTKEEIIDGLEIYTVGRLKKARVYITVEELQNFIDEIKSLKESCDNVILKDIFCMGCKYKEQEPKAEKAVKMRDATPKERESVDNYIKSISKPTGIKFDEEQEELDFIQPHKRIPVTLTVSGYDKLIDLANAIESDDSGYWTNKKISSALKNISSIKPQPCKDVISRQAVLNTISELNAISFYEAQKDSKECYYEIKQAVENMSPVVLQPKTGHWIPLGNYDDYGNESTYKCSECGDLDTYSDNYCPNCGADMRGEKV